MARKKKKKRKKRLPKDRNAEVMTMIKFRKNSGAHKKTKKEASRIACRKFKDE